MIGTKIERLKNEYNSYHKSEKLFIIFMMLCSLAITAEAAITRATSNSVFISAYSTKFFPIAWLASIPLNLLVVSFYNRFIPTLGCFKMLALSVGLSSFFNIISAFYLDTVPFLPFLLYLWKDIFIILMFQQLWSVIHATVKVSKAKYLYGIFYGMGGLGSILGSMVPGFFAVWLGSEKLLLTTLIFYLLVAVCYYKALKIRENLTDIQDISLSTGESTDVVGGLRLIKGSSFLKFILIIVVCMQATVTITDFQFSTFLEKTFTNQDIRTEFLGKFFGVVNTVNVFLQFIGGFFLVRTVGLKSSHLTVPFILIGHSIAFLFYPTFSSMSLLFASAKALDYSIFGIIKEMLYVPLKVDEKFKAKAIIDVFAYRTSKAIASLCILFLQTFIFFDLNLLLSWTSLFLLTFWSVSVMLMFKHYHKELDNVPKNWATAKS